jgi:hypothetical protein
MTTLLQNIRAINDRLADPRSWTQGAFARDLQGSACRPDNSRAVRFCLSGAADAIAGVNSPGSKAIKGMFRGLTGKNQLSEWNDKATHEDVKALLADALIVAGRRTA